MYRCRSGRLRDTTAGGQNEVKKKLETDLVLDVSEADWKVNGEDDEDYIAL